MEVIDQIVASPKEVDTLLHALWDTLLSDYLDLTDGATPADAERAAACVYYAAIAALIYCSYAGYKYGIVRKLIADVHSRYADWRELEPQLFPCVERYGPSLGQWMDDYVTSDSYLSDAIEEVLRPKRKAAPQAEEEPAFKPTRNTFLLCNGSMAVHVELMLSALLAATLQSGCVCLHDDTHQQMDSHRFVGKTDENAMRIIAHVLFYACKLTLQKPGEVALVFSFHRLVKLVGFGGFRGPECYLLS